MIKDYSFQFVTGEQPSGQIRTPKINGKLLAILLKSNKMYYSLKIILTNFPEVSIFEERTIRKDGYILLKTDSYNTNLMEYNTPDYYFLNDELDIILKGMKGMVVDIIFRVEDGSVKIREEQVAII